jgi:hypothetical protein
MVNSHVENLAVLVALPGFVNLQKDILRQILGFRLVAQGAADKIKKRLLVLADQGGKGRAVAALYAQHQGGIRVGVFRHGRLSLLNAGRATRFRFP